MRQKQYPMSSKVKTPNSRQITIFRTNSFMEKAQGADTTGYLATTKQSIGSYFEGRGSMKIASGISAEEEKLLLPSLLEVGKDHPEFIKKRGEFYANMDTSVDYTHGRTLEIGLESSNTDAVSANNMPINLMDFLRYKHAIGHPNVALTKEIANGNQNKTFYIFDKTAVQQLAEKKLAQDDAAMKAYLQLENNPEKITQALTLLGKIIHTKEGTMSEGIQKQELKAFALKDPAKFLEVCETKQFETNYWLKALENAKVLKKIGAKYFDGETDELLANGLDEMIMFFQDDLNSDKVIELKARWQEKKHA